MILGGDVYINPKKLRVSYTADIRRHLHPNDGARMDMLYDEWDDQVWSIYVQAFTQFRNKTI